MPSRPDARRLRHRPSHIQGGALVADEHRHLILDCSNLTFCDSFGLRTMMNLWQSVQPDGSVTIASPSDHLNRLLQIAGLADALSAAGPH